MVEGFQALPGDRACGPTCIAADELPRLLIGSLDDAGVLAVLKSLPWAPRGAKAGATRDRLTACIASIVRRERADNFKINPGMNSFEARVRANAIVAGLGSMLAGKPPRVSHNPATNACLALFGAEDTNSLIHADPGDAENVLLGVPGMPPLLHHGGAAAIAEAPAPKRRRVGQSEAPPAPPSVEQGTPVAARAAEDSSRPSGEQSLPPVDARWFCANGECAPGMHEILFTGEGLKGWGASYLNKGLWATHEEAAPITSEAVDLLVAAVNAWMNAQGHGESDANGHPWAWPVEQRAGTRVFIPATVLHAVVNIRVRRRAVGEGPISRPHELLRDGALSRVVMRPPPPRPQPCLKLAIDYLQPASFTRYIAVQRFLVSPFLSHVQGGDFTETHIEIRSALAAALARG